MIDATNIIIALVTLLIGGSAGGFIVAWRKDSRQAPLDVEAARKAKIEVTLMIEELAERAVAKAKKQLQDQEEEASKNLKAQQRKIDVQTRQIEGQMREISKLHVRINQLEGAMRDGGLAVPAWEGENA